MLVVHFVEALESFEESELLEGFLEKVHHVVGAHGLQVLGLRL